MPPVLVSNSFPFALIRRRVVVEPRPVEELRATLQGRGFVSVWGHANTLSAASAVAGADLRPDTERPALVLDAAGLPSYKGRSFGECWLLSPEYTPGFRPQPGAEIPPESITGWQVLRLTWTP